jgi:hypothetical protein
MSGAWIAVKFSKQRIWIPFRSTTTRKRSLENVVEASRASFSSQKGPEPAWAAALLTFPREML